MPHHFFCKNVTHDSVCGPDLDALKLVWGGWERIRMGGEARKGGLTDGVLHRGAESIGLKLNEASEVRCAAGRRALGS